MKLRKNTTTKPKKDGIIQIFEQNLVGILGVRGAGKSVLLEAILERYNDCGYTVLDLWGAPNMENAFWIFAKKGHKKRIPITIVAPDSLDIDPMQVIRFNDKHLTKHELIKFVKVPNPTAKYDSEQNELIVEIIANAIVECRKEGRILVFNPFMFPNEVNMFRVLEIILRSLFSISHNFFHAIKPESVGKTEFSDMTIKQITYHKMAFGIREFGEVVPARLKGDQSGESTRIKKSLLKFVRLARHFNIDGVVDYQNASDAESSIRNQFNIWLIKKWTEELGGDSFKSLFDRVKFKRKQILERWDYSQKGIKRADNFFPEIENLSYYWMYVKKDGVRPYLEATPELHIRHKEPMDNWEDLTGIVIKHDPKKIQSNANGSSQKIGKREEKMIMERVKELKNGVGKKSRKWDEVLLELNKEKESGDIISNMDFKTMKVGTLQKMYSRWKNSKKNED